MSVQALAIASLIYSFWVPARAAAKRRAFSMSDPQRRASAARSAAAAEPSAVAAVAADAAEEDVVAAANGNDNVSRHLEDMDVRKVIYVPGRLLNLVVSKR